MSLINEALKRARQSHARQALAPAPGPALQPVIQSSGPRDRTPWLVAAALAVLLLGLWFVWIWWRSSPSSKGELMTSAAPPKAAVSLAHPLVRASASQQA